MRKRALQRHYSCSMQEADGKSSEHSKNERVSKIGKMATMQRLYIAFAKWSVFVKK